MLQLMHDKTTQILKGSSFYLTSSVITSVATFVISIFISRYLGKEGLGVFAVSLSVVLIGVVLSELGFNPLIMREFAPGRPVPDIRLRSIVLLRSGASFAIAVCLMVFAFFLPSTIGSLSGACGTAVLIVTRSIGSGLENVLKARLQHTVYLVLNLATSATQLIVVYAGLQIGFGIGETILTLAATDTVKLAVLMFLTRRELRGMEPHDTPSTRTLKLILGRGMPFMVIGVLTVLGERSDILLLATLRNAAEAGVYSAADRFLVMGNLIDSALFASALPILSSLTGEFDHRRVTRQVIVAILLLSVVGALILFFAAPLLMNATFRFSESVLLLQVLSISFPAMLANRVLRTALYSLKKERLAAIVLLLVSLVSLGLNVVFIPRFGAIAAAGVTVIGEFVLVFLYGIFYLNESRLPNNKSFVPDS